VLEKALLVGGKQPESRSGLARAWARLGSLINPRSITVPSAGAWARLLLLFALALLPFVLLFVGGDARWLSLALLVAGALSGLVFGVVRATDRFVWYGASVFLSVVVLGGITGMIHTARAVKVQPVAVIRKGDDVAVCGIFVAENDKRLYLGQLGVNDKKPSRAIPANIFSIPKSDIDLSKLGRLQKREKAAASARRLAYQLYVDRAENHLVPAKGTSSVSTTPGKGGSSKQLTTESPSIGRHPTLKARPPESQLCTRGGGRPRPVTYDP
jgi:hypothetical protein